jgi:carbon-monoxide dehydrogenase medium subunit
LALYRRWDEVARHPASGYAVVGVAAVVNAGSDGAVDSARIAVTGATSKAPRAGGAERALEGKRLTEVAISAAATAAPMGLDVNGDFFASEEYRRHLISVLTARALRRIAAEM